MLPISALIKDRMRELGIERTELVRRMGYRNQTKGLKRLDAILAGELLDPMAGRSSDCLLLCSFLTRRFGKLWRIPNARLPLKLKLKNALAFNPFA